MNDHDKFDIFSTLVNMLVNLLQSDEIDSWFYDYPDGSDSNISDLWLNKFIPGWNA